MPPLVGPHIEHPRIWKVTLPKKENRISKKAGKGGSGKEIEKARIGGSEEQTERGGAMVVHTLCSLVLDSSRVRGAIFSDLSWAAVKGV